MLSTLSVAHGPVSDNAEGITEMCQLELMSVSELMLLTAETQLLPLEKVSTSVQQVWRLSHSMEPF